MPLCGAVEPGAGACDASVIPQSKGLSLMMLLVMRLSWVAPVSSLMRIPPELFDETFSVMVENETPMMCIPSPQSKSSPVSKGGWPGQV